MRSATCLVVIGASIVSAATATEVGDEVLGLRREAGEVGLQLLAEMRRPERLAPRDPARERAGDLPVDGFAAHISPSGSGLG